MPSFHGGRGINRVLAGVERQRALEDARSLPAIEIDRDMVMDVESIAFGIFSPLTGFLGKDDLQSVVEHGRLANDVPWTIPIVLDLDADQIDRIKGKERAALVYQGAPVAILDIEDVYSFDKDEAAVNVYGTDDIKHPGVAKTIAMNGTLVSGPISLLAEMETPFKRYALKPIETRVLFKEKGWRTVVAFQTRNVPHIGHEYLQKTALTFADGLFINPLIGKKKPGDFLDEVIVRSYEALIENYYLKAKAVMAVLQTEMRYAGPREAIHHAIMRKNFGCTHFIVGRDHAGVGSYYDPFAAQKIFDDYPDIGIVPVFFNSFFYCTKCGSVSNEKTCPHDDSYRIGFSGTKIRQILADGGEPPAEVMRPEVTRALLEEEELFVEGHG